MNRFSRSTPSPSPTPTPTPTPTSNSTSNRLHPSTPHLHSLHHKPIPRRPYPRLPLHPRPIPQRHSTGSLALRIPKQQVTIIRLGATCASHAPLALPTQLTAGARIVPRRQRAARVGAVVVFVDARPRAVAVSHRADEVGRGAGGRVGRGRGGGAVGDGKSGGCGGGGAGGLRRGDGGEAGGDVNVDGLRVGRGGVGDGRG